MSFTSALGKVVQAPFSLVAKPVGWALKPFKKPLAKVFLPVAAALNNPKVQAGMGLGYSGLGIGALAGAATAGSPMLALLGLLRLKAGGTMLANAFDPRIRKAEHKAILKAVIAKKEAQRKLALKLGLGAGGAGGIGAGYLIAKRNNEEDTDEPRRIYRRTH